MKNSSENTKRKSQLLIAEVIALSIMLLITTYALFSNVATINNNTFAAQGVSLEINGGERLFDDQNLLIEPGKTCEKIFSVRNTGTADAYVRLFLENVSGAIAEVADFEIYTPDDQLLFKSNAFDFVKDNPYTHKVAIKADAEIELKMVIRMKENAGNTYQNGSLFFDVVGQSIQARNNDGMTFTQ